MVGAGVSIFGSIGWIPDMAAAMSGRMCSGPIQTGSFINGDRQDYRTSLEEPEKGGGDLNEIIIG
jgi:hypothetical protein